MCVFCGAVFAFGAELVCDIKPEEGISEVTGGDVGAHGGVERHAGRSDRDDLCESGFA